MFSALVDMQLEQLAVSRCYAMIGVTVRVCQLVTSRVLRRHLKPSAPGGTAF